MVAANCGCAASDMLVFADGEREPYACAVDFSGEYLVIQIPIMSQGHDEVVDRLKRSHRFRVLIQGRVGKDLVSVVDKTLLGFRFDCIRYTVDVVRSPSSVAELRFVASQHAAGDGGEEKTA